MSRFEILCVTMHQTDFSKVEKMNIHSNVVFANQADETSYKEFKFDNCTAKMITTTTRGVGKNRNIGLTYASADICLFSDDDVVYDDDVEQRIIAEFDTHPDADIIIFHFNTDSDNRRQRSYFETRRHGRFERMPWGTCRVAFRLNSARKANLWFTTLFGGGCVFPSGEDSMWLTAAKKAGLTFYVSKETIGKLSFEESTWFTGYDEKFFYGKGAIYEAIHRKTVWLWMLYFALRTRNMGDMKFIDKIRWMNAGRKGYSQLVPFVEN